MLSILQLSYFPAIIMVLLASWTNISLYVEAGRAMDNIASELGLQEVDFVGCFKQTRFGRVQFMGPKRRLEGKQSLLACLQEFKPDLTVQQLGEMMIKYPSDTRKKTG